MSDEIQTTVFDPARDAHRLYRLAEKHIYFGTSSWKYPGWVGSIYNADYSGPRSPFVKSKFEKGALAEFAAVFPAVCYDGGYYRFPDVAQLETMAKVLPDNFRMTFKCAESITLYRHRMFPKGNPYAGQLNTNYLQPEAFIEFVLDPIEKVFGKKSGVIVLEFSPFYFGKDWGEEYYDRSQFVRDLDAFLSRVPSHHHLAVEVRDRDFIRPDFTEYLECLRHHQVAHVLNSQTNMPLLEKQLEVPGIFTSKHHVVYRGLTAPGLKHEQAVKLYQPYDRTQLPMPSTRVAIAEIVKISLADQREAHILINNRLEGNAPNTIASVLDLLDAA